MFTGRVTRTLEMIRWLIGGAIGGAVGVAIWIAVGYFTQYEVGWIAWGVGFLVGVGVRYAAFLVDQEESAAQGILAAVMACGSIVFAKWVLFLMAVGGGDFEAIRAAGRNMRFDEEAMIASVADEIVEEMMTKGIEIQWPPGKSYAEASRRADYPPSIWQQAADRWHLMSQSEQEDRRSQRKILAQAMSELAPPSFASFFSFWDILWFGLAAVTAYKIGVGTYGGD